MALPPRRTKTLTFAKNISSVGRVRSVNHKEMVQIMLRIHDLESVEGSGDLIDLCVNQSALDGPNCSRSSVSRIEFSKNVLHVLFDRLHTDVQ